MKQAIQLIYGTIVAKDLLHVKTSNKGIEEDSAVSGGTDDVEPVEWAAEAYFTSPNYQAKKTTFLLFINRKQCHISLRDNALHEPRPAG